MDEDQKLQNTYKIRIVMKLILIGTKQDAIHNNLTTQNKPLIFHTLTNENEKTPTPQNDETNIKSK